MKVNILNAVLKNVVVSVIHGINTKGEQMRFTPLYDKLLVRRSEEVTKVGLFYVPDAAQDKPQEGTVLSCGNGRYEKGTLVPLAVKEGDTILFGKYAGSEIKIDGEEFLILKEEEVLGILKKDTGKPSRVA